MLNFFERSLFRSSKHAFGFLNLLLTYLIHAVDFLYIINVFNYIRLIS